MTTIYLIAPILLIYFILSVVDYKKAFHIYVVLFPFLNDAISVSFNANLPLITGRRILLVILIFAYLINYIRIKKLRDRFKSNSLNKDLIVVSILLFLVTIANYSNRGGIVSFISILVEQFLVIGIIWSIYTRKEEIGKLIVSMVFSFGIIAIYGIYVQISGYNPFIMILQGFNSTKLLYVYDNVYRSGVFGRNQSVFEHPITYGAYLTMIVPFSTLLLLTSKNVFRKISFGLISIICLINIVLTNSRSPLLFLFLVIFFWLYYSMRYKIISISRVSYIVLVVPIIALIIPYHYYDTIFSTVLFWQQNINIEGSTLDQRFNMIRAAYDIFLEAPLFGHGLTTLRNLTTVNRVYGGALGFGEGFMLKLLIDTGFAGILAYYILFHQLYKKNRVMLIKNISRSVTFVSISVISIILGYIIFLVVTGEMNTIRYFFIVVALSMRYNNIHISENLIVQPKVL